MNKKVLVSVMILFWLGFTTAFAENGNGGDPDPENIMLIRDVTANIGEIITIEIEILNDEEFVGFNLDAPIPEGFTYIDGTAELFRKTVHMFVFNVLPSNVAKIMGFSVPSTPFIGNDGVIFSFDVQTPNEPGEYVFAVEAAVIGNIDAEDILTGTIDGIITLIDPDADYTLTLIAEPEEGGEVFGAGEYQADTPVEVDAEASEGWLFVNWTDLDGNIVSEEAFNVIEMPEHDLTLIANFREMVNKLFIHDVEAEAGDALTIKVEIENDNDFAGFSLQIELPENFDYIDDTAALHRIPDGIDHELVFSVFENVATISATLTNGIFVGSEGVVLEFILTSPTLADPDDYPATYTLTIIDPAIYNEDGDDILTEFEADAMITLLDPGQLYNLTLLVSPEGAGMVTGDGPYNYQDDVEVTATPNDGWEFINWTDANNVIVSDQANYTFPMPASDLTLTANFEQLYDLDLVVIPDGAGTVSGAGQYLAGTIVNIEAEPEAGYVFVNWTEGDDIVSELANFAFEMPAENVTLTANFRETINEMKIHDKIALASSIITIELEIMNEDEFIGFNFILPIPDGFEYQPGTAELLRIGSTTPVLSFDVDDNNIATVEASATFTGNEGVVLQFDVHAPEDAGDYYFVLTEPEMTLIDGATIVPGTTTGTVALIGVDQEFTLDLVANPEAGGTVEGAGDYGFTEEVTIHAIPNENWEFVNWTDEDGNEVSVAETFIYNMPNYPVTLTANFLPTINIMKIHDIMADPGETVTIEVEVINKEEFAYFDLRISLPSDFVPDMESGTLFRSNDNDAFTYNFNLLSNNIVRITAYSIPFINFEGNDGVIFSFDVQTPADGAGFFNLNIHDASITKNVQTDVNLLDETINGLLYLDGVPENYMVINDLDDVAPGDVVTIEMEILNNMNFSAFGLEIPLPDGFDYVAETAQLFRGAEDHVLDFEVNEDNVVVIHASSESGAFFTGNEGIILSFDLQIPADAMGGEHPLPIENAEILDIMGDNIISDTTPGTIAISYSLVLSANPPAGGTVNLDGEPSVGGLFNEGDVVLLSADANTGYEFINWTDAEGIQVSADAEFSYTMPANNVHLTANFLRLEFAVVVEIIPEDAGEVEGGGNYFYNQRVTLSAQPNEGWIFLNYTDADGDELSDDPVFDFFMPLEDVLIYANFELIIYTLTLLAEPEEGGEVFGAGEYALGEQVEVDAVANEGWLFVNWTDLDGNVVSEEAFNLIEMLAEDLTLIANFEEEPIPVYTLTLLAEPAEGGEVFGAGEYEAGQQIEVDAVANEGWLFVNWTNLEGEVVSEEEFNLIDMPAEDLTLIANFELDVSVIETETVNLNIFPNPVSNVMNIESGAVITSLRLIDMLGQVVYHASVNDNSYELNVTNFRNGVYFVQINTTAGIATERVHISQ